ncbi:MAG: glycerol-3-phosphate dehydrogenase/oxidase [Thermoguttaceae bacterium]|jgi:glycerol-3-phosphate dehydrogenase|nr:glycerol-3-phosphate dehydrogenase/oxidase [Thermoguttaceae bacterium]
MAQPAFDLSRSRADAVARLTDGVLDVLVLGGGIVGAGVARDAAMRGLRVGLVEQHDFAFGTSSRSSRLLHGGLRYLAQGRIGLVYEASREKRVLHRIAPHLAEPLAFVFPTYRGSGWPLWQLRIGVRIYDLLCGGRNLGPSSAMTPSEVLAHVPGLNREGLTGAVRYYDGLTNDARLVLDTLRSAAASGAVLLNYTRWEHAAPDGPGWRCGVRDVLADRGHEVRARTIVNATGPWAESLPQSGIRLRLTKGVHLVVDRDRLPVPDAVVMTQGRRILFAIPWGRRVILGTTDTDYAGPIDDVRTEAADVEYVLGVVNRAFPCAGLTASDVRATWAGLRPLIASRRGGPSDISRSHEIRMPHRGWIDVAGGKLTTYRLIAEQVVDRVAGVLGRGRLACTTAHAPLLPPEAVEGQSGILPPPVRPEVVEHACRHEWSMHLDDVVLRRTSWQYDEDNPGEVAERVSGWMAAELGWDEATRRSEVERYRNLVRDFRGVSAGLE